MSDEATKTEERPGRRLTPEGLAQTGTLVNKQPEGGQLTDYSADAGAGFEGLDRDEQLVPFLRILQSNSPQVDPTSSAYIQGAQQGMLLNTATGQIYDGKEGVVIVPAARDHNYVEYVPRDAGGGFVSIWAKDDPRIAPLRKAQGQFGKLELESGNELTETFYFYVEYTSPDGETQPAMLAFASTQIKKYKQMMTRLAGIIGSPPRYPLFAHRWRLSTVPEQNKKGKFHGYRLVLDGATPEDARLAPTDDLYLETRGFSQLIRQGRVRADYEGGAPAGAETEEEITF